ncbi:hypothetical protein EJ887_17270, partial [Klebsiella pneumoniae subsp. pneumoniae]
SLELMTPVDYILRESKNCNMWWTHTAHTVRLLVYCAITRIKPATHGQPVRLRARAQHTYGLSTILILFVLFYHQYIVSTVIE